MTRELLAGALVLLGGANALAGESVDDLLAAANEAAGAQRVIEASTGFGKAAALAHDDGDVLAEERVATDLVEFLHGLSMSIRPGGTADDDPDALDAARAVMAELDAKRLGAYVSVQSLAMSIVQHAVETGETRGLQEAADALAAQAKAKSCGLGTKTNAALAAAMLASPDAGPLEEVYATCEAEAWADLGTLVAVETAARHVTAGSDSAAREILESASRLVLTEEENADAAKQKFRQIASARLKDAPESVREALGPLSGSSSVGSKGGKGGKGASSANPESEIGKAWPKLSRAKPFVTVKRKGSLYVVDYPFAKGLADEGEIDHGEHSYRAGGVTVRLSGPYVSLCMIDHVGLKGMPGGASNRRPWFAWYLLGDNETWRVAKNGVVTIR